VRRAAVAAAVLLVTLAGVALWSYRAGLVRLNYPSYATYPVRGVDVSHHQGRIDWPAVRGAGLAFAFIKASEGVDHLDPEFRRNWAGARAAGVTRGAYHFFTFCSPGAAQAEHFASAVGGDFGELPPVADVEFVGNCRSFASIEQIRLELREFLTAVERVAGRRPAIYFTRESWARILAGSLADYAAFPRDVFGEPADEGARWSFWQFADNGSVPGIRGRVYLDLFRGAPAELDALARGRGSLAP
jgi:lysozyme